MRVLILVLGILSLVSFLIGIHKKYEDTWQEDGNSLESRCRAAVISIAVEWRKITIWFVCLIRVVDPLFHS